jgi:putative phage-type endonuclease
MKVITATQGTAEWLEARMGKVTASRIADLMAKTKTGYGASRTNYATELALEIITGKRQESFTNAAMQWGTETEPLARAAYEAQTGEIVEETGLVIHPRIDRAGASPDGLINGDGLLEIKCPQSATHLQNMIAGKPEGKYILQMQWQMACLERAWCDFASFDPRFPSDLQLFTVRVPRDDALISQIETEVLAFIAEVDQIVNTIQARRK